MPTVTQHPRIPNRLGSTAHGVVLCLFLCAPSTMIAEEILPEDADISVEEWREMTQGRTVWYSRNGRFWGKEYYHPNGGSATFVTPDGACMTAPWAYSDGLYCFAYAGMDCFRHVRRDGRLVAVPLPEEGGPAHVIERITGDPLSCAPPLSS